MILIVLFLIAALLYTPLAFLVHHWVGTLIGLGCVIGAFFAWAVAYCHWEKLVALWGWLMDSWLGQSIGLIVDEIKIQWYWNRAENQELLTRHDLEDIKQHSMNEMLRLVVKGGRHAKGYHQALRAHDSDERIKP